LSLCVISRRDMKTYGKVEV